MERQEGVLKLMMLLKALTRCWRGSRSSLPGRRDRGRRVTRVYQCWCQTEVVWCTFCLLLRFVTFAASLEAPEVMSTGTSRVGGGPPRVLLRRGGPDGVACNV